MHPAQRASAILFHYYGLSAFLTAPLAGLSAAFAGFLIGVPTLRLRGAYFALVTMIITFAVQVLVLNRAGHPAPGTMGPPLAEVSSTQIRDMLARGVAPVELVPRRVLEYAHQVGLYGL